MLFNSVDFLVFFPVTVLVFFLIPKKLRAGWLLTASCFFYMSWNPKYALLIAFSILITWFCGILLEKFPDRTRKKLILTFTVLCDLGILFCFKYANFFLGTLHSVFARLGHNVFNRRLDLLLPVGISFYVFQTISYAVDVYRGKITAERSLITYALFVAFFPQLVAGPIERSDHLLPQIRDIEKIRVWDGGRIKNGLLLMLWGFFQKLVIADRASIAVDRILGNYQQYGFVELSAAMVLFAFQIYCDFGGYTNIARGAARVMGFSLIDNFRQPYLAESIRDFWRRWHISLTKWFTDYLYIPLGGSRKGTVRKWLNILIVFTASGLWHGADWSFVVWGLLHACFQIIEDAISMITKDKAPAQRKSPPLIHIAGTVRTFILADFAWIFFASASLRQAAGILKRMLRVFTVRPLTDFGLTPVDRSILAAAILILIAVDLIREKGISISRTVSRQPIWIRWALYLGLLWVTILFGVYGMEYDVSSFIYFQF